ATSRIKLPPPPIPSPRRGGGVRRPQPQEPPSPIDVRGQLHLQALRLREAQARLAPARPEVADEVLHAFSRVPLLEPVLDGEAVAGGAGPSEGEQPDAQPLLEQDLLHVVVPPGAAVLDDDLFTEPLMPGLLLDDLLDHAAVGHEGAL